MPRKLLTFRRVVRRSLVVNRFILAALVWLGLAAVGFVASAALAAASSPAPKPNVLVILADDLGRGDYSAFGTRDIRTPNMDRLFAEGMTFRNFFANSCVCSPSRASLLTGCYPDRVGVPGVKCSKRSTAPAWPPTRW